MADNTQLNTGDVIATDELASLNGGPPGTPAPKVQRTKMGYGSDSDFRDIDPAHPLPTGDPGGFHYAADTSAGTVSPPGGARLKYVEVLAGGTAATATIAGGATITVPANTKFSRAISGLTSGAVVIGGGVAAYYVEWVV